MKKWLVALILVAGAFVGFVYYALRLTFADSVYTRRGMPAYYIVMRSPVIRNCPVIRNTDNPVFYYDCGDGPAPLVYSISYHSQERCETLVQRLEEYLCARGLSVVQRDDAGGYIELSHGTKDYYVISEPSEDGIVEVTVIEEVWDNQRLGSP